MRCLDCDRRIKAPKSYCEACRKQRRRLAQAKYRVRKRMSKKLREAFE